MSTLACTALEKLLLDDPFMIASSHHTDNQAAFRNLVPFVPAAITLKTISNLSGGAGSGEEGLKRDRVSLRYPGGARLGLFTDGPKKLELWDTPTCLEHIQVAERLLPRTKIGLSVLQGEDYAQIAHSMDLARLHFVELNWKYTFRGVDFLKQAAAMESDIDRFFKAFIALPALVKLPNELVPYLQQPELRGVYGRVHQAGAALLVMNTKKAVVPPSRQPDKKFRERGVIFGDYLFLDTFNSLRKLVELRNSGWEIPRLVATGGITDIGAVVDVLAAGAEAVQLCSILDYRKVSVIDILRRQLRKLISETASSDFEQFKLKIRKMDHADWLKIAESARSLETYDERVIGRLASNKKNVLDCLSKTLVTETLEIPDSIAIDEFPEMEGPEKLLFLINRANIAPFILSHRLLRTRRFSSELIDDSKQVRKKLQKSPEFDLAILAKRVAEAIIEKSPSMTIVGRVGYSVFEVVGPIETLSSIQNLYYFVGTGSKESLKSLLPLLDGKPELRRVEDSREELSALLPFWGDKDAILARGPLTQLYAYLTEGKTRKDWKAVREIKDDLVLVATSRFYERAPNGFEQRILRDLQGLSREVNLDADRAAREAYDLGYMNHIANLLGANVLA